MAGVRTRPGVSSGGPRAMAQGVPAEVVRELHGALSCRSAVAWLSGSGGWPSVLRAAYAAAAVRGAAPRPIPVVHAVSTELGALAGAARAFLVAARRCRQEERARLRCWLLDDSTTDDTLLHIASFLADPEDLLCLQLTNRRFGARRIAPRGNLASGASEDADGAVAAQMLSLVEEAARRWVAGCSEQERGWVSRHRLGSWLGLVREVLLLRLPPAFDQARSSRRLHGYVASAKVTWANVMRSGCFKVAASTRVMRSGRHSVQFTIMATGNAFTMPATGAFFFGVTRPDWDARSAPFSERFLTVSPGDRIGMLLDIDQGTVTAWKNDEDLGGTHLGEALSHEYCWAVATCACTWDAASVRIGSAPLLPSHV